MGEQAELVELSTQRLRLRAWRDSDREPFAALNADPVVMEHFPATLTRAESDAIVDRLVGVHQTYGFTGWAVEVVESSRGRAPFVGFVGLFVPAFDPPFAHAADPCVEVAWRLAADWWGLGIATEAALESLRHAFEDLALPEVVAMALPGNLRSRAVMDRIGMRHDGEFDDPRAAPTDPWRRLVLYRATPRVLI